jgi:hypothetical protein
MIVKPKIIWMFTKFKESYRTCSFQDTGFLIYFKFCNDYYFDIGIKNMRGEDEMPKIVPIRELRDTNTISQLCHSMEEPIFVTKNGYGDMVIMSLETFEKNSGMSDFYGNVKFSKGKYSDLKDK